MEQLNATALLTNFTIFQRKVNCLFRKDTGINKTQLEILTYSNTVLCFNPYEVQKYFFEMNLQQVRVSIRKLADIKAIEIFRPGLKNRPAVYIITTKGNELLKKYVELWHQLNS